MDSVLRIQTTVGPGHRIEITAPELEEGRVVEVMVTPSGTSVQASRSALEIIQGLQGHRLFKSPEEVDAYLKAERDSWDR